MGLESKRLPSKMKTTTVLVFSVIFPCFCTSNFPFVGKNVWKTVANYLNPQNEKKFKQIHKSLNSISRVYDDVSDEIITMLKPIEGVPWRFFEHLELKKLFAAENLEEKDASGRTPLMCASIHNLVKVAQALIEANVDVNADTRHGTTALHIAAGADVHAH